MIYDVFDGFDVDLIFDWWVLNQFWEFSIHHGILG